MHLIELSKLFHRLSHPVGALAVPPSGRPNRARFKRLQEKTHLTQAASVDNSRNKPIASPLAPVLSSPRGYLPIYVGEDNTKYVIKAKHLNNPLVADLLERSVKEHGYSQIGALKIWCDAEVFESVLATAAANQKQSRGRFSSTTSRRKDISSTNTLL